MQVQDMYWSTSEIRLSFNHYKILFTDDFDTIFELTIIKENEHRDIECVSANTFIIELFFEQQDDNKWQSVQDY